MDELLDGIDRLSDAEYVASFLERACLSLKAGKDGLDLFFVDSLKERGTPDGGKVVLHFPLSLEKQPICCK